MHNKRAWLTIGVLLANSPLSTGCDDDDNVRGSKNEQTSGDSGAAAFAVPTQIYSADFATSTSYVPLVPSLDVDEISLDDAKEFDGRASVARVGKYVFIASSSQPVVNRFTVAEDGSLEEAGRLNFMNYGLPSFFSIDAWGAVFVDEHKAYIFNAAMAATSYGIRPSWFGPRRRTCRVVC